MGSISSYYYRSLYQSLVDNGQKGSDSGRDSRGDDYVSGEATGKVRVVNVVNHHACGRVTAVSSVSVSAIERYGDARRSPFGRRQREHLVVTVSITTHRGYAGGFGHGNSTVGR